MYLNYVKYCGLNFHYFSDVISLLFAIYLLTLHIVIHYHSLKLYFISHKFQYKDIITVKPHLENLEQKRT